MKWISSVQFAHFRFNDGFKVQVCREREGGESPLPVPPVACARVRCQSLSFRSRVVASCLVSWSCRGLVFSGVDDSTSSTRSVSLNVSVNSHWCAHISWRCCCSDFMFLVRLRHASSDAVRSQQNSRPRDRQTPRQTDRQANWWPLWVTMWKRAAVVITIAASNLGGTEGRRWTCHRHSCCHDHHDHDRLPSECVNSITAKRGNCHVNIVRAL